MSFLLPTTISLTWNKIYAISCFALAAAGIVASITWVYRMDYLDELKTEIASRKEASEWKVPETIKKLNSASEKLDRQLASMEEIEDIKSKNINLDKINSDLKTSLAKIEEERTNLKEHIFHLENNLRLMLLPTQEFKLVGGESAELVKNHTTLGVQNIYPSSASISINNDSDIINVGNRRVIKTFSKMCTLTLTKIAQPQATFTLTCDDQPPPA